MRNNITYAKLCRLLEEMNFERVNLPTHVLFDHLASGAKVILRCYQARDMVDAIDLGVVRKTLDERGLMGIDSFELFLRKKPA